jgi:hypothetical protein
LHLRQPRLLWRQKRLQPRHPRHLRHLRHLSGSVHSERDERLGARVWDAGEVVAHSRLEVEDALDGGVAVVVEGVAAVVEGVAGRVGGEVETEAAPAFEEKAARELAEAEARAAAEDARRAAQLAAQLEAESKRLALEESRASALAAKAQERAEAAAASVGGLSSKAKELGGFGSFVSKLGTVKGGEPRESRRAKSDAELASVSAAVESALQQSVPKPSQNIPAEEAPTETGKGTAAGAADKEGVEELLNNKGIVLLVTTQKEGAVTGGPAFTQAVGDKILEAVTAENLPVLAMDEKDLLAPVEAEAAPGINENELSVSVNDTTVKACKELGGAGELKCEKAVPEASEKEIKL